MDILQQTRNNSAALADYLASVMARAAQPLADDGLCLHLWRLEHVAAMSDWIDPAYRRGLALALIAAWRDGVSQVSQAGWRILLYQDVMPTLALRPIRELPMPLPGAARPVAAPGDVLMAYHRAPWPSDDALPAYVPAAEDILEVITAHAGSLGRKSAAALGLKPGSLRFVIEQDGLARAVNIIRADHGRALARFRAPQGGVAQPYLIYQETIGSGARATIGF
ncbi:hypothetical protein [Roseicyclus sp.]|uniref:hypothetical protein n=1 Tax=Roseicyclus sp. TaxID=1914329 RepID=UPI003F6C287C